MAMKKLFLAAVFLLVASPALSATYSYNFATVESPLSDGGKWDGGYSGFGSLKVVTGGKAEATTLNSDERMTVNSISPTDNQYAQAKVVTWNTSAADTIGFQLLLRWTSPTTATGCEIVVVRITGQDYISVQEMDSGTETLIGSAQTITVAVNDVFKAEISGTTLTGYQNGVQRVQQTCDNVSSGRIGLGAYVGPSGALTDMEVDDFEGGDLTSPPATRRPFAPMVLR